MLSLVLNVIKSKASVEETVTNLQYGIGDREAFIAQYLPFIRKAASSVCRRYITEQDDEYSIGLFAFHQAIEQYSYKKGKSFFAFAELLIKRDIIDYIRKEVRHNLIELQGNHQDEVIERKLSLTQYLHDIEDNERKEEIVHFQKVLAEFKISFSDLVRDSPKHRDTREHVIEIAKMIANEESMMEELFQKKKLPLKQIEPKVRVSRKTLERHRKYIIAVCLIYTNNYVYLKEYAGGGMKGE